jgi:RNA polymerase sigma-70 factor (ECF subfamily)
MAYQTVTTQPATPPEASLVGMAKAGDEPAINQLVSKYWSLAYGVAVRIVRSHEDAEEVAQDTLWAAMTHLSTFREDACFRTWLHRIAVNQSLIVLRKKHSRAARSSCSLAVDSPPRGIQGPPTPEELLLETEYRTAVDEGLSRVPRAYSVALRLASSEDRSTKEIAEYMGISISAAKARLNRGRAYLRREVLDQLCVKSAGSAEWMKRVQ